MKLRDHHVQADKLAGWQVERQKGRQTGKQAVVCLQVCPTKINFELFVSNKSSSSSAEMHWTTRTNGEHTKESGFDTGFYWFIV